MISVARAIALPTDLAVGAVHVRPLWAMDRLCLKNYIYKNMDVSDGSLGSASGNTKKPLNKRAGARSDLSKYWCATIFNHTADQVIERLEHGTRYILGDEICPTTGRFHLQCFFIFPDRIRALEKKEYKSFKASWHRKSEKSTLRQAIGYCKKDKKYVQYGLDEYLADKYDTVDEIIEEIRKRKIELTKDNIFKEITKMMYKEKSIKMIKVVARQKEFYNMIYDLMFPPELPDWYEPEDTGIDEDTGEIITDFLRV